MNMKMKNSTPFPRASAIGIIGSADGPTAIHIDVSASSTPSQKRYSDADAPEELRQAAHALLPGIYKRLGIPDLEKTQLSCDYFVSDEITLLTMKWSRPREPEGDASLSVYLPDGIIQSFGFQNLGMRGHVLPKLPRHAYGMTLKLAYETIERICPDLQGQLQIIEENQSFYRDNMRNGYHFDFQRFHNGFPMLNQRISVSLDHNMNCIGLSRFGYPHRDFAASKQACDISAARTVFLRQFVPELVYLFASPASETALPVYRGKAGTLPLLNAHTQALETVRDPENGATSDYEPGKSVEPFPFNVDALLSEVDYGSPMLTLPEPQYLELCSSIPELMLPSRTGAIAQRRAINIQGDLLVHLLWECATLTLCSENNELLGFCVQNIQTNEEAPDPVLRSALSDDELTERAEQFLRRYKGEYISQLRSKTVSLNQTLQIQIRVSPQSFRVEDFDSNHLSSTLQVFLWQRVVKNIPVIDDALCLALDRFTGHVAFFEQNWHKNAVFAEPCEMLSAPSAAERLLQTHPLHPVYCTDSASHIAKLYWGNVQLSTVAIHAVNGTPLAWNGAALAPLPQIPRNIALSRKTLHELAEYLLIFGYITTSGSDLTDELPLTQSEYLCLLRYVTPYGASSPEDIYRDALSSSLLRLDEVKPTASLTCAEGLVLFLTIIGAFLRWHAYSEPLNEDEAKKKMQGAVTLAQHLKLLDPSAWNPDATLTWGEALRLIHAFMEVRS